MKKISGLLSHFSLCSSQHFSQPILDPKHFDPQPNAGQLNIYQGLQKKGTGSVSAGPSRHSWATKLRYSWPREPRAASLSAPRAI